MSVLVVASKVKAHAQKKGMRTSQEAIEALSKVVVKVIDAAVSKAKEDGRATIKECDILVAEAEVAED